MAEYSTTIQNDFEIYHQEDNIWRPPAHSHNFYEIWIVTKGAADLRVEGKLYHLKPPCIAFINRFETHDIKVTQYPYGRYVMSLKQTFCTDTIKDDTLLSILFQRPDSFSHIIELDETSYAQIKPILKLLLSEYHTRRDYQNIMISALLSAFFVTVYREAKDSFPVQESSNIVNIIMDIQRDISLNYAQPLVLEDLETRYFISKYYICRNFKKITGFSIKDYQTRQRMARAKDLLANTKDSISKISEACGYNSVNHFNRTFHQREGQSPMAYRNTMKQKMRTKL